MMCTLSVVEFRLSPVPAAHVPVPCVCPRPHFCSLLHTNSAGHAAARREQKVYARRACNLHRPSAHSAIRGSVRSRPGWRSRCGPTPTPQPCP
eukprot:5070531-Prymnesium_polylepis.2